MQKDFALSTQEITADFEDFLKSKVNPQGTVTIIPDGQIHRFSLEGHAGNKAGAYALYLDGRYENNLPAGFVMDWRKGKEDGKFTWKYTPSNDERKEYGHNLHNPEIQAKRERQRKEREKKLAEEKKLQDEKQAQAKAMAFDEYNAAWTIFPLEHEYIKSKFAGVDVSYINDGQFDTTYENDYATFKNYSLRVCKKSIKGALCNAGELLIPMRNITTGAFQTLIRIPDKPDDKGHWPKQYYKGISTKGAGYIIRPQHSKTEAIYICEGFSTAFALMIALKSQYAIIAAGSCHNLLPVCQALKERYTGKIIIAADNDMAGIAGAEKCVSERVANAYIKPETAGFDWCDELIANTKRS